MNSPHVTALGRLSRRFRAGPRLSNTELHCHMLRQNLGKRYPANPGYYLCHHSVP